MSRNLSIWTIYDHPTDHPDKFVARMFVGEQPTENVIIADDLETIRAIFLQEMRLLPFKRFPGDDSKIVEVWL